MLVEPTASVVIAAEQVGEIVRTVVEPMAHGLVRPEDVGEDGGDLAEEVAVGGTHEAVPQSGLASGLDGRRM
jgi:hypothetical protein